MRLVWQQFYELWRKKSVLVNAADVALVLPEVPESTIVNAPTTSTTMMLIIGDALAVALLEQKGFSKNDYGTFHPGGKLGTAFIKVSELMHKGNKVPQVSHDTPMTETLIEMTQKSLGCAVIVDKNQEVIGVITDGDLRRHMSDNLITLNADKVMTKEPLTIPSQMLATEALAIMEKRSITSLIVVDEKKLQGVLHIHDILRAGVA